MARNTTRNRGRTAKKVAASAPPPAPTALDEARTQAESIVADAEQLAATKMSDAAQEAETTVAGLLAGAQQEADELRAGAEEAVAALRVGAEEAAGQLQEAARMDAEQVLAEARAGAEQVLAGAAEAAAGVRSQAEADAARRMEQAAGEAERLQAEASDAADQLRAEAKNAAEALLEQARADAASALGKARTEADRLRGDAEQVLARGQEDAVRIRKEAAVEADRLRAAGTADRERAQGEAETVRVEAAQLRDHALRTAEALRLQAEETAARIRAAATTEAGRVLEDATGEADRTRRAAEEEANRQRVSAQTAVANAEGSSADLLDRAKTEAAGIVERAAIQAEGLAGQAAADVQAAQETRAEARAEADTLLKDAKEQRDQAAAVLAKALDPTVQKLKKRTLEEEAEVRRRTAKRKMKEDLEAEARTRREEQRAGRPTIWEQIGKFFRDNARRIMVVGPITAPMAVAWSSQTSYAMDAFGWWLPFALGFAAAWELTTTFTGWMYHQARSEGDSGLIYRVMTWVFAAGAAAMNYAHHCGPGGAPTQAAVAFAGMSIVGMILWELYASLLHRRHARKEGRVTKARPHIGLIRWLRYPRQSWTAWSLTINDESLDTVEKAWAAAGRHLVEAQRVRHAAGLGVVRKRIAAAIGVGGWAPVRALPPVPRTWRVLPTAGSPSPSEVPQFAATLVREPVRTGLAGGSANPQFAEISEPGKPLELEPPNRTARTDEPQRERTEHEAEPRTGGAQQEVPAEPKGEPRTSRVRSNPQPASAPGPRGPANLTDRAAQQEEQVGQVLNLINELGFDAVKLQVVMERTGMAKTTAHHRLNAARTAWKRQQASRTARKESTS